MGTLPASVRVAVWGTAALGGTVPVEEVRRRALPDLDHVTGLEETVRLWRDLGERMVLVALPRPGNLTGLPRGSAEFVAAATEAGETVFVPGLGGALVPQVQPYGPAGDRGWQVTWTAYDTDPVPPHVVQAVSLSDVELALRRDIGRLTDELAATARRPPDGSGMEDRACEDLHPGWGLPPGVPPRALRVIELAGAVTSLATVGLDGRLQADDSTTTVRREGLLQRLQTQAGSALAAAANVAALHLAAQR